MAPGEVYERSVDRIDAGAGHQADVKTGHLGAGHQGDSSGARAWSALLEARDGDRVELGEAITQFGGSGLQGDTVLTV